MIGFRKRNLVSRARHIANTLKKARNLFSAIWAITLAGGYIVATDAAPHDPPADPRATSATRRVLDLVASRHPIISGQMLGGIDGYEALATTPYRGATYGYQHDVADLARASGKWVGLVGLNYGKNVVCNDVNPFVPTQRSPYMECSNPPMDYHTAFPAADRILTDYWNAGGLVTAMWQVANPWTGQSHTTQRLSVVSATCILSERP
jgi:hypothetical protein